MYSAQPIARNGQSCAPPVRAPFPVGGYSALSKRDMFVAPQTAKGFLDRKTLLLVVMHGALL